MPRLDASEGACCEGVYMKYRKAHPLWYSDGDTDRIVRLALALFPGRGFARHWIVCH